MSLQKIAIPMSLKGSRLETEAAELIKCNINFYNVEKSFEIK